VDLKKAREQMLINAEARALYDKTIKEASVVFLETHVDITDIMLTKLGTIDYYRSRHQETNMTDVEILEHITLLFEKYDNDVTEPIREVVRVTPHSPLSIIYDSYMNIKPEYTDADTFITYARSATILELYIHGCQTDVYEVGKAFLSDSFIYFWDDTYRNRLLEEGTQILYINIDIINRWVKSNENNTIIDELLKHK